MSKRAADLSKLKEEAERVLRPLEKWSQSCHAASLAIVRAMGGRVARGSCRGVRGQHSWAVLGMDCYAEDAVVVDGTLWSYDAAVEGVWVGTLADGLHRPHGAGSIWNYGRPAPPQGAIITLTPKKPLSAMALEFLELVGPLDRHGWDVIAHAPVEGWPANEILAAISQTKGLSELVPIDTLGMITDLNPGGLYLPKKRRPRRAQPEGRAA